MNNGINRLVVPVLWPNMDDFDDNNLMDLKDPQSIPKSATDWWRTITCPREIEFYLQLRNRQNFGQAEADGTPFTLPLMQMKFNWEANTKQAELVLLGKYEEEELDDVAQLLLDNLQQVQLEEAEAQMITREQFIGKMKVWQETTSTSPVSKRHLGHYKALLTPPPSSMDVEEAKEFKRKQTAVVDLYVNVINYCVKYCYVLERWKEVCNMMIFKEPGNIKYINSGLFICMRLI